MGYLVSGRPVTIPDPNTACSGAGCTQTISYTALTGGHIDQPLRFTGQYPGPHRAVQDGPSLLPPWSGTLDPTRPPHSPKANSPSPTPTPTLEVTQSTASTLPVLALSAVSFPLELLLLGAWLPLWQDSLQAVRRYWVGSSWPAVCMATSKAVAREPQELARLSRGACPCSECGTLDHLGPAGREGGSDSLPRSTLGRPRSRCPEG